MSEVEGGTLSRKELRHMLLRRRNERVMADRHALGLPTLLVMHPHTAEELRLDNDPDERFTLDFEGREFMGIPILEDARVKLWRVEVRWP